MARQVGDVVCTDACGVVVKPATNEPVGTTKHCCVIAIELSIALMNRQAGQRLSISEVFVHLRVYLLKSLVQQQEESCSPLGSHTSSPCRFTPVILRPR